MVAGRDGACRAVQVAWVPGSYELPVVASAMARSGQFDAVVCIGTVVCTRVPFVFCSDCPWLNQRRSAVAAISGETKLAAADEPHCTTHSDGGRNI